MRPQGKAPLGPLYACLQVSRIIPNPATTRSESDGMRRPPHQGCRSTYIDHTGQYYGTLILVGEEKESFTKRDMVGNCGRRVLCFSGQELEFPRGAIRNGCSPQEHIEQPKWIALHETALLLSPLDELGQMPGRRLDVVPDEPGQALGSDHILVRHHPEKVWILGTETDVASEYLP